MTKFIVYIILSSFLLCLGGCKSDFFRNETPEGVVYELLDRVLGDRASEFRIVIENQYTNPEYAIISIDSIGPVVRGNSVSSICKGISTLIQKVGTGGFNFTTCSAELPEVWTPMPEDTIYAYIPYRWIGAPYWEGYETHYWDWESWENHLDRMALQGVNLLLLTEGVSAIWNKIWQEEGISNKDIDDFHTSAPLLPFQRSGKFNHIEGPPPKGYFENKLKLLKQIHNRAKELEILLAIPAFEGFVPRSLKHQNPNADIQLIKVGKSPAEDTYWLDPRDPLFGRLQRKFWIMHNDHVGNSSFSYMNYFSHFPPLAKYWETQTHLGNIGKAILDANQIVQAPAQVILDVSGFQKYSEFWTRQNIDAFVKPLTQKDLMFLKSTSEYNLGKWIQSYLPTGIPLIFTQYTNKAGSDFPDPELGMYMHNFKGLLNQEHPIFGWGAFAESVYSNHRNLTLIYDLPWLDTLTNLRTWQENYCESHFRKCNLEVLLGDRIFKEAIENTRQSQMTRHFGAHRYLFQKTPGLQWAIYPPEENQIIQLRTALDYFLKNYQANRDISIFEEELIEMATNYLGTLTDLWIAKALSAQLVSNLSLRDQIFTHVIEALVLMDQLKYYSAALNANKIFKRIMSKSGSENYKYTLKKSFITSRVRHPFHPQSDQQLSIIAGMNIGYYLPRWKSYFNFLDTRYSDIYNEEKTKAILNLEDDQFIQTAIENILEFEPEFTLEELVEQLSVSYIGKEFAPVIQ